MAEKENIHTVTVAKITAVGVVAVALIGLLGTILSVVIPIYFGQGAEPVVDQPENWPLTLSGCQATVTDGTCIGCLVDYGRCTITNEGETPRYNSATWAFSLNGAGLYSISTEHASPDPRPGVISVNSFYEFSDRFGEIGDGGHTSFEVYFQACAQLQAGENKITLSQSRAFPHIRALIIEPVSPEDCN